MAAILEVRDLSKAFGRVQALDRVRLDVEAGRVHALMGENGAGKSTLMKVLAGLISPTSGTMTYKGEPYRPQSPHDALRHGIAMIHQELMPFRAMTVAENVFAGHEPVRRFGFLDRQTMHFGTSLMLARLDLRFSADTPMAALSVAEMQTVEIAKALAHDAELLIMDEPTSALSEHEIEKLFGVIEALKSQGVAIIYISHKLDEVYRIGDDVTVLRDGAYVGTDTLDNVDSDTLIGMMVGRELEEFPSRGEAVQGDVALSVEHLGRQGAFRDASFGLRYGEVLGIGGLMGAGRTELVNALYGLAPADTGVIRREGVEIRVKSPAAALAHGIALVTEDRARYGVVPELSVQHNLTLSTLRRHCAGPFIRRASEARCAGDVIARHGIKTAGPGQKAGNLSGGNQQKVVLARALLSAPSVLILDEPTRGIDIGAKREVHAEIARLAAEGMAVIVVSSELPELLALSDRVLVMRAGEVSGELAGARMTQEEVMQHAMHH